MLIKKRNRGIGLIIMAVLTALLVSACGNNSNSGNSANNKEGTDNAAVAADGGYLAELKKEGKIKIGTVGKYPPFTYVDESGKLTGFDVEIAREVFKRVGLETEFVTGEWDTMFAGLEAKRFDLIANNVKISPDREEKYDFSIPYVRSTSIVLVREDYDDIKSTDDFKGKTVGASPNSAQEKLAKQFGANTIPIGNFDEQISNLISGRIDFNIQDKLSFNLIQEEKKFPVKVIDLNLDKSNHGLMFRKGNEDLVKAASEALQTVIDDGTLGKLSTQFFKQDITSELSK
ncbi:transporter substrate-binding domain-containing protein [Paenibacillus sp. GCM10023252]|uniref:transporter substrate-binding domain-containing protein n=1 Tax=Paenibacillus sp. GCM10023252 TaxID=3252649 RepID=UPI0036183305